MSTKMMNAPRTRVRSVVTLDSLRQHLADAEQLKNQYRAERDSLRAENQRLREAAEWFIADFEAKVAAGSTSAQNFSHAVSLARAALGTP